MISSKHDKIPYLDRSKTNFIYNDHNSRCFKACNICMAGRGKVKLGVGVVRSGNSAILGKRGRRGGNRDNDEFNVRALMDIQLCPCRTCFAGSSGRPREQQQGSSHKKQWCVLCQAKKAPKQTTNYCARVSHPLWRNRLHLCNTKRWKGNVHLTSNCLPLISFV